MPPLIVSCSQSNTEAELRQKYGKYHILNSVNLNNAGITIKYGNKSSLPKVYNNYITKFDPETVLVFAHDDVCITDNNWIEKLDLDLRKYDVVGLAGGSDARITEPCLWHIMCPRDTLKGRVSHVYEGTNDTFVTHFGNQGRVLILDGLFLAFKAKTLLDAEVWFDETNPCIAHFYDIDFSLTCNKKKLKLGTTDIDVVHNSHGLKRYTEEWLSGQAWFKQKFADGKY